MYTLYTRRILATSKLRQKTDMVREKERKKKYREKEKKHGEEIREIRYEIATGSLRRA